MIFAGVKNQVPPFDSLSESEFLARFKAMIISLLDKRYEYDDLISGQLPFYKGKLFCESIVNLDSVKEVIAILQDEYRKEKENNSKNYTRVRISTLSRLKWTAIITSIVFFVSLIGLAYMLFVSLPQQETVAKLRLAFVDQDYSKVVSTVKNVDSKSLSQDDRYMVAYSVIKTEPLTNKQKKS
ncbi:putative secretion system component EssB/YukC [Streptococcus oralis]|uniref:Putative secretion system component EssB/YukC n=1 Tax=Streptococcus oralis TaxID=1303 RepID=A0A139PGM0_STROR|nr:putative secretion system component EssB/YukC [Streptococcus oralis]